MTSKYEALADWLIDIEKLLAEGKSPRAIAKAIGHPGKYQSISRYKKEVFDVSAAASAAWEAEKSKTTEDRLNEGKARIVDSLELLNLAKCRAEDLLSLEPGSTYKHGNYEEDVVLTLGTCVYYWDMAMKIAVPAIKQEQEIAGDDPESRKADSLLDLINAVESRKGSSGTGDS